MKILKIIGASILTILFTIVLITGIFVMTLNRGLSLDNIETSFRENTELVENFLRAEMIQGIEDIDLFELTAEEVLDFNGINELFITIVIGMFDYLLYAGPLPEVTIEDINSMVRADILEELTAEESILWEIEANIIMNELNDEIKQEFLELSSEEDMEQIALFFDSQIRDALIGVGVLFAAFIALVLFSFYRPLVWLGGAFITAGTLLFIFGSLLRRIIFDEPLVEIILNNVQRETQIIGLSTLIIGILLVALYFPLKVRFSNNNQLNEKLAEF